MSSASNDNFFSPRNHEFYAASHYSPLDTKRREIRLLQVAPQPPNGRNYDMTLIEGMSLLQKPAYHALSYHCGDPDVTRYLRVNGHKFNAFRNLKVAIQQAVSEPNRRHPGHAFLLWVDQICINQSDHEERAHQVSLMKDIYSQAEEVYVSLRGDLLADLPLLAAQVVDRAMTQWTNAKNADSWLESLFPNLRTVRTLNPTAHIPDNGAWDALLVRPTASNPLLAGCIVLLAIDEIANSPWWRRAWVFQEYVLSQKSRFLVQKFAIRGSLFYRLMSGDSVAHSEMILHGVRRSNELGLNFKLLTDLSGRLQARAAQVCNPHDASQWNAIHTMLSSRVEWKGEKDLSTLLAHARKCDSSDPRDKIYAFIGLASDLYGIVPDYSSENGPAKLMLQTAKAIIVKEKRLDILEQASWNDTSSVGLPSWVPVWTTRGVNGWSFHRSHKNVDIPWAASKHLCVSYAFLEKPEQNLASTILQCQGLLVGTIVGATEQPAEDIWRWFGCGNKDGCSVDLAAARSEVGSGDEMRVLSGAAFPYVLRRCGLYRLLISQAMLYSLPKYGPKVLEPRDYNVSPVMYGVLDLAIVQQTTVLLI